MTGADDLAALGLDVSRETCDRLAVHVALLRRWQPRINLVGPATLEAAWQRHILDSAQILPLIPAGCRRLADLGSGAGFPGLVLAILLTGRDVTVDLVEADARKAAFLTAVIAETGAPARVHVARAEVLAPLAADCVTARALAPLDRLLPWVHRHLAPGGLALLAKGRAIDDELTLARRSWTMGIARHQSRTDPSACILRLTDLAPIRSPA